MKKQATTWLIVSVATLVLCNNCCFGIIGAVFCFMAMQAADQGNALDAENKLKWGKIITIVGTVLGLILTVVLTALYAAQIAAAFALNK